MNHTNVIDYQPAKATALSQMVENYETLISKRTLPIIKRRNRCASW
ncbi:hypothetical protein ACLB1R_22395 [Escherichia coli]